MLSNLFTFVKTKGSSLSLPAHGLGGARATSFLAAHFAKQNTTSSASEKSESGKERAGRNSPQTPLPPRPKNKIGVAKRFRRLGIKTSKQNNFQFLLRKIWRAGDKKLKENCFALLAEVRRAETRSEAIQAFFVQKRFELRSVIATIFYHYNGWSEQTVLLNIFSNFVTQTLKLVQSENVVFIFIPSFSNP